MLVDAAEVGQRVLLEDVLRSVPVVGVPVQDEDPLHSVDSPRMDGPDGDVVDEAEPHGVIPSGVVPGGPHGAEDVLDAPVHDGVDARHHPPCGEEGDVEAFGGDRAVHGLESPGTPRRGVPEAVEVAASVDLLDDVPLRNIGGEEDQAFPQVVLLNGLHQMLEAPGTLPVAGPGPVVEVFAGEDEPRPAGRVRVDDLVPVPLARAEEVRFPQGEWELLHVGFVPRVGVAPFPVPGNGDPEVFPELCDVVGVVQPGDFRILNGEVSLLDEGPDPLPSPVEFLLFDEIEPFLRQVLVHPATIFHRFSPAWQAIQQRNPFSF